MENDIPQVNPIEDQRKEALRHYEEAARIANHWSSFVRNAILAYNPQPSERKPPITISKSDGTGEIEIFQEVKDLAIAWIENYIPHNSIVPEIGQKWKLAEDIQRIVNEGYNWCLQLVTRMLAVKKK